MPSWERCEVEDALTGKVIGAAIAVHKELGPGLLESAYEACLAYELGARGIRLERQKVLPVYYRGLLIESGYRVDLLVESRLMVELKAVDMLLPRHEAQLLSYLKLSGCSIGLLINFHSILLKDGIRRLVR